MGRQRCFDENAIIEEARNYGIINPVVTKQGRQFVIEGTTPSTLIYKTNVHRWRKGSRPPKGYMMDVPKELLSYGLTLVGFELVQSSKRPKHVYLVATSPDGRVWKCRLNHFANGAAKPPLYIQRNVAKEVEEFGLEFVRETMEKCANGNQQAILYIGMPNGAVYRMPRAAWLGGTRPKFTWKAPPDPTKAISRLYYVRFNNADTGETFYKIGITSKPLAKRFHMHTLAGYSFEVLGEWMVTTKTALKLESHFIKAHRNLAYKPCGLFPNGGTECFSEDVLRFDRPTKTDNMVN